MLAKTAGFRQISLPWNRGFHDCNENPSGFRGLAGSRAEFEDLLKKGDSVAAMAIPGPQGGSCFRSANDAVADSLNLLIQGGAGPFQGY